MGKDFVSSYTIASRSNGFTFPLHLFFFHAWDILAEAIAGSAVCKSRLCNLSAGSFCFFMRHVHKSKV